MTLPNQSPPRLPDASPDPSAKSGVALDMNWERLRTQHIAVDGTATCIRHVRVLVEACAVYLDSEENAAAASDLDQQQYALWRGMDPDNGDTILDVGGCVPVRQAGCLQ